MADDLFSSREISSLPAPDLSNLSVPRRHFPERIVTAWRRFSSGLWRVPEGDISKAYCADTIPKLKTFKEDGQLFTNCGATHSNLRTEADCYPLLPEGSIPSGNKPYSYEGRSGRFQGKLWTLGPKVTFASAEPTIDEWAGLYRAQYADGGFSAQQATYADFLLSLRNALSENEKEARAMEIAGDLSTFSNVKMLLFLDAPGLLQEPTGIQQLNLF